MQLLQEDEHYLYRALDLARESAAFASPNPTVGCVLVRDGKAIGEGAHRYDQFDHAEVIALKSAVANGHSSREATAFVTLEPCAHHGRTGPCAAALVAAGVRRCVVATVDPNPLVSGQGLALLHQGGVEVVVAEPSSEIAVDARRLNDAFSFSIQHGRPFVTLKAAVSLDGYLAPPAATRASQEPHWITGVAARLDVQRLRHASDAILTGVGTVLADDPSLTDRTGLPRRRPLLRVVLDSQLRTPPNAALVRDVQDDLLFIGTEAASELNADLLRAKGAEIVRFSGEEIDLGAVLHLLYERGTRSVLLEAGSHLNASFLRRGLVDKAVLYYGDIELGTGSVPFAANGMSPYALQQTLTGITHSTFPKDVSRSEDVRVTGYIHDPWQAAP